MQRWKILFYLLSGLHTGVTTAQPGLAHQTGSTLLSLMESVERAQKHDNQLRLNGERKKAAEALASSPLSWPDPVISVSAMNVPMDTLTFRQEPMTQLKVDYFQALPRGDKLAITEQRLSHTASKAHWRYQDYRGQLILRVASLWLDGLGLQNSLRLVKNNRKHFEQLLALTRAGYASAVGRTRQHDLISAQLEIVQLDKQVLALQYALEDIKARLSNLTGRFADANLGGKLDPGSTESIFMFDEASMGQASLKPGPVLKTLRSLDTLHALQSRIARHPAVLQTEESMQAGIEEVALAKQEFKTQWGFFANYGYRAEDSMQQPQADFISLGVRFELPVFSKQQRQSELLAAQYRVAELKYQKHELMTQFIGNIQSLRARLQVLRDRKTLYDKILIPQIKEQASSALNAYTTDDGDFSGVVKARIDTLKFAIEQSDNDIEIKKMTLRLKYFLMHEPDEILLTALKGNSTSEAADD